MALDCEKFIKLIPSNTLKFLYKVLPDLKHYISKNNGLKIGNNSTITDNDLKIVLIFLSGLRKIEEYSNLFGVLKINDFTFRFRESDKDKESENKKKFGEFKQFYDENTYFFDFFKDEISYTSLTPLKLFDYHLRRLNSYEKDAFYYNTGATKDILDKLNSLVSEEKKNLSESIKNNISKKISIQLMSYLECASKIRAELFSNRGRLNQEYFSSMEDINTVALFLSLYFYDDIQSNDPFFISERDIITKILKDAGIDLDGIKRVTNLNISSSSISNNAVNYFVIDKVYRKYIDCYRSLGNENYIYDIVKYVLSGNYSDSIALEKIFLHLNCYLNMIDLSSDAYKHTTEEEKIRIMNNYTKDFYSDLSWQVREFINFTAKAYSLILDMMKHDKINSAFVHSEDDADTLALYIASHYFDGDVDKYFANNGVSYEKVLKLLNIEITKKNIENMPLDVKALVERFKRYVYEGVNSRQSSKNLAIKDIVHNLCNKKFNRSSIMNDLFAALSDGDVSLDEDFLSQLNKYFEDREKAMKEELRVKYFHDMPLDTVGYLENVSGIYSSLSKITNYEEKDKVCFSLLLGIFIKDLSEICKVFNSMGFDYKKVLSSLGIPTSKKWDDPNIEILQKYFGEYVFGGVNKDCKREDITIKQIAKNIFNKELNDSFYMNKLLNDFGLSYDIFEHFDELYKEKLKNIEQEENRENIEKKISNKSYDTSYIIRYTLRIFNELKRGSSSSMLNAGLVTNDGDLIELSLVLATLSYSNNALRFFNKYDITLERVCEYCGLDSYVILDIAKNDSYNAFDLMDYFNEYMVDKKGSLNNIDTIINNIFDERLNSSLVLENICNNFGISYPILKREVLSKQDYEESLSIEDRTEMLLNEKVDAIKLNDRKSMLRYGNDLGSHSKYIFNELPRLQLNDTNDSSIIEIKSSLDKLYLISEPKKKKLFNLFSKKEDSNGKSINEENLRILKNQIDDKIQVLEEELLGYDAIREYMEAYRKKNKEYLLNVNELLKSLEEKAASQGDSDEDLNERLKCDETIRFMRAKADRFFISDQLYKQKLIEISQRISAHNLTINSLEMARDIFIPLVWSQLAIEKGANTSNSSLEITDTVINLFGSLLIKNAESTVINMNKLKDAQINNDLLLQINDRVNSYISILNADSDGINTNVLSLDNIEINPETNLEAIKKLTLSDEQNN